MRRCLLLSVVLACLLLIPMAGYASPNQHHVVRRIILGRTPHSYLVATVVFAGGGDGDFGGVSIIFSSRAASQGRRIVIYHGNGMLSNIKVEAQDFVHRGRKQLFVSCEMGEVYNVIYDYDGKHIRKVYDSGGGRLQVTPVRIKNGAWELIEEWAIYHYNGDDLGVAFKTTDNGVLRTLVWRNGQFVPKFPGPTIVR